MKSMKLFLLVHQQSLNSGMEAAFWEASIQQYLLASQCWAHLGAIVVPGIVLQWLWSPGGDLSGF